MPTTKQHLKRKPTALALSASDLNNIKGKKAHPLYKYTNRNMCPKPSATEICVSGHRHKISNNDLHSGVDENTCKTGSFTLDSVIGF
jgi:hypothetical protein